MCAITRTITVRVLGCKHPFLPFGSGLGWCGSRRRTAHRQKAAAHRAGISQHTVKFHLEAVFAKLGVTPMAAECRLAQAAE